MDFRNRNDQPVSTGRVAPSTAVTPATAVAASSKETKFTPNLSAGNLKSSPSWLRLIYVALLFSLTVLCVTVVYFLSTYNPNESKYVLTDKYQAVFLSSGQVYFGKIATLNNRYVDLRSTFYLNSQTQPGQTSASTTNSNQFTLVKLGCELHGPYDQMIINHSDVTFWENLRDDSQVVKSIKQWQQQNPNGQTCPAASSSNTSSQTSTSSTSTTPAASSTSSSTTKKP